MPPTLNLEHLDPAATGIDWIAKEARETRVEVALALARGLEGQNVALALRASMTGRGDVVAERAEGRRESS